MFKNFLIFFFTFFFFVTKLFADSVGDIAGSSGYNTGNLGYYDKAIKIIKSAKKYEKKNKIEKAKKRYQKALKYLLEANKKIPGNPDIINYLGYTTEKLGDAKNAEIYYLLGLSIDPDHIGINEFLGVLYLETSRIDKAKERLAVLEKCNCEEYQMLNSLVTKY